jgi:pyruvate,water dikinase
MNDAYTPPGPGLWDLDISHFDRPFSRFVGDLLPAAYEEGQRDSFQRMGLPADTVALRLVDGFAYTQLMPLAGPPGGKPPPAWIFKIITRLHPEMRRRARRAREVVEQRLWLEQLRHWDEERKPGLERKLRELQDEDLKSFDDAALHSHIERCAETMVDSYRAHFEYNMTVMVPVGMFLHRAAEWSGRGSEELVDLVTGRSPVADEGAEAARALVVALDAAEGRGVLDDGEPGDVIEALVARDDEVGAAARRWRSYVGPRLVTASDVTIPTGDEVPHLLVEQLRQVSHEPTHRKPVDPTPVREAVPEAQRARFDQLLEDAAAVYRLRDERCAYFDSWCCGLARRGLMEAGRRLQRAGHLDDHEHAVHLDLAELGAALVDGRVPTRDEIAARAAHCQRNTDVMPRRLGSGHDGPPPFDALPAHIGEMLQGVLHYVDLMENDAAHKESNGVVKGHAASKGEFIGTARLVLGPQDFGRVKKGDVLIARCTMPTYNAVLPLLGGIVTDRGGTLSHAAIVSREFGIPGVVGTRDATKRIPDGARVRIDGDTGTVEVIQ